MTTDHTPSPRLWNIWWTLMVISGALTMLAGVLEILGIWHDLGLGVGVFGLAATIMFGSVGATAASVNVVGRELRAIHDTLGHMLRVLNLIYAQLEQRRS